MNWAWVSSSDGSDEARSTAYQRVQRELLAAERTMIIHPRHHGVINDDVMRRFQRDLDLEDLPLEA